jgi:hypothetical protein
VGVVVVVVGDVLVVVVVEVVDELVEDVDVVSDLEVADVAVVTTIAAVDVVDPAISGFDVDPVITTFAVDPVDPVIIVFVVDPVITAFVVDEDEEPPIDCEVVPDVVPRKVEEVFGEVVSEWPLLTSEYVVFAIVISSCPEAFESVLEVVMILAPGSSGFAFSIGLFEVFGVSAVVSREFDTSSSITCAEVGFSSAGEGFESCPPLCILPSEDETKV